jgi:DNA polymerase elongation subunit (family B)
MVILFIDLESVPETDERIASYKATFEPTPMVEEVAEEPVEKPKKPRKPRVKKARGKTKAGMGGLHYLTGRIISIAIKPLGKEAFVFHGEEREILTELHEYLSAKKPYTLVGYNVSDFDYPFIRMRGLLYGLDFGDLLPFDKYNKQHIDLYNVLGGKWGINAKLSELAWFFGFTGAYGDGSQVEGWYRAGNLLDVYKHNIGDVTITEQLFQKLYPDGHRKKY